MACKIVLLGMMLLAAVCVDASATEPDHADFWRTARITIGADGKISALAYVNHDAKGDAADQHDVIGQRLDSVIHGWTFEPGAIDGKPTPTETTLHMHLEASKTSDGNYSIQLLDAFTGVGFAKMSPPEYPRQENMDRAEALIVLVISVRDTGEVSDVAVESTMSSGSGQNKASFIKAARKAAMQWRFQPEKIGDHAVASMVRMPVSFCSDVIAKSQCPSFEKARVAKGDTTPANIPVTVHGSVKLIGQVAIKI